MLLITAKAMAGVIFGLLLVLTSSFLLRAFDVTVTSNLLFCSFMQMDICCFLLTLQSGKATAATLLQSG